MTAVTTGTDEIKSNVLVFQEQLVAPYGIPTSVWDAQPLTLELTWHQDNAIRGLTAKGNSLAVVVYPKTVLPDTKLSATDSIVVFKRQPDNLVQWSYNVAGGTIPNFGNSVAVDLETVLAAYPQNDTGAVKSGVHVISPKLAVN